MRIANPLCFCFLKVKTTGAMKTVYLFMHHYGRMAHTLFSIPIDLSNGNGNGDGDSSDEKYRSIEPIIEFPASEYPRVMTCAKLGSRLYFIGGERDTHWSELYSNSKDPNQIYPSDVYVLDDENHKIHKLEVGMNTGKPIPSSFTADGKLFVLGSCGGPNLVTHTSLRPTSFASSSLRFFEVFDPTTNEWTLLDDPPVTTPTIWVASPVVAGRKVYLYGLFVGRGSSGVVLSFHLDSYKWEWAGSGSEDSSDDARFLPLRCQRPGRILLGDTYYGLTQLGSAVVRQKITEEEEKIIFRFGKGSHSQHTTHGFCHLGDTLFCTVVTGSFQETGVPGMLDQNRRFFCIRVFRDILVPGPESISTDLLYSADYLFQSTYSSFGTLYGCYPFHSILHSNGFDAKVSQEKKIEEEDRNEKQR